MVSSVPRILLAIALMATGGHTFAQSPESACRASAPPASKEPNVFTQTQEAELGDAVAERYESSLRVIEDDAVTEYLRAIGNRLVSHLPPNELRIRFSLVDIPDANAFVLPGGRIYVSRKLVAFTRSEDELAGVLGHELGHLVARQQTLALTRQLREVLGVTSVTTREDIFDKYNRLMDNSARKPNAFKGGAHSDADQIEADRLGIFVVRAAGYDIQAHVTMFDRFAETEGSTGNFLSTLFGVVNPDAKRLGQMIKSVSSLPPGCGAPVSAPPGAYEKWQAAVMNFQGLGRKEALHNLIARTPLKPPLQGEVTALRFSPNGRYLLAQDDAGFSVLTREPFKVAFRVDASDAQFIHFTPDSLEVVTATSDLRVERWSVETGKLTGVRELVRRKICHRSDLSPDGRIVACLDTADELSLIDVASGAPLYQKKGFTTGTSVGMLLEGIPMGFSTDGRFFVAGFRAVTVMGAQGGGSLVYDFQKKAAINLRSDVQKFVTKSFVFTGPDRLIGLNPEEPSKSAVVTLPAGTAGPPLGLAAATLGAPASGNYLFLRPFQKYAVGVLNLATQTVVKGNAMAAFDLHNDVFAAERGTGDIGLYRVDGNQLIAEVSLPATPFGRVMASAVSPDLRWLAVSENSRGALWDLTAGTRVVQIRGFRGAAFEPSGTLLADLPKNGADPRAMLNIDPLQRQLPTSTEIKDRSAIQFGRLMAVSRPVPATVVNPPGVEYEVRDVMRNVRMWTHTFPKDAPAAWANPAGDALMLAWPAASPTARELIRLDERLRATANLSDLTGDYLLEALDAERGTLRGRLLIETGKGSFRIHDVFTAGDWTVLFDSLGRVLVYSLSTGELKGYAFGLDAVVSSAAGVMAVDVGGGRLALYDIASMKRRDEFTFVRPIQLMSFTPDGQKIFVLTQDQTTFVLGVSK